MGAEEGYLDGKASMSRDPKAERSLVFKAERSMCGWNPVSQDVRPGCRQELAKHGSVAHV